MAAVQPNPFNSEELKLLQVCPLLTDREPRRPVLAHSGFESCGLKEICWYYNDKGCELPPEICPYVHIRPSCPDAFLDAGCRDNTAKHQRTFAHNDMIKQRRWVHQLKNNNVHSEYRVHLPSIFDYGFLHPVSGQELKGFHVEVRKQSIVFNTGLLPNTRKDFESAFLTTTRAVGFYNQSTVQDKVTPKLTPSYQLEYGYRNAQTPMQTAAFKDFLPSARHKYRPKGFDPKLLNALKWNDQDHNGRTNLAYRQMMEQKKTVHISNLDNAITDQELAIFIKGLGTIVDCRVVGNVQKVEGKVVDEPRKAYVDFKNHKDAQIAIWMLDQYPIGRRMVQTDWSPKEMEVSNESDFEEVWRDGNIFTRKKERAKVSKEARG
ncbi:hypothetical protein HYFRA_00000118 [Hymenoscyphus fraxineus]|uniref:RRM domain-containing protein n=1 Tax=Hymenoscyphus fraxineus TaxID=746836 RepID=A0A9N9L4X3_9HELO|nr:hypothetical protein HYFRA_00000118 [Hymenoscyphus fraxineus]